MKARALVTGALALLALPRAAGAYESQCYPADVGLSVGACGAPPTVPVCKAGFEAARGRQLGEHTFITKAALGDAGLGFLADLPILDPLYAPRRFAFGVETWEPAATSVLDLEQTRPQTIAELSQLPDTSYALPDYLLGNEHCQPRQRYQTRDELVACHTFGSHMGALNSTHFLPQAEALYRLYHGIALKIAARCSSLSTALGSHPLSVRAGRSIAACEREALTFEAIGAHYLEDAWSAGHMWERWGTPLLDEGLLQRWGLDFPLTQFLVGSITGILHGWRSLAQGWFPGTPTFWHDQANLPGDGTYNPLECGAFPTLLLCLQTQNCSWDGTRCLDPDRAAVTFKTADGQLFEGAGDIYFQECTARRPVAVVGGPDLLDGSRNLAQHPSLEPQRERLLGCVGAGFREVYLAGPRTLGAAGAASLPVASALEDGCWKQRLTNHSMFLGWGISRFAITRNPLLWALVTIVPQQVAQVLEVTVGQANTMARIDLVTLAFRLWRRARVAPDETDMAEGGVGDLLGFHKNSAYAPLIAQNMVPYLEQPEPTQWSSRPGAACAVDADCATGSYCGTSADQTGAPIRVCFRAEAAILAAFRPAEVAHWCSHDNRDDLVAALRNCGVNGSCRGCPAVLVPRLRNAEKAGMSAPADSICDALETAGVAQAVDPNAFIYLPYSTVGTPDEVEARAQRAARCVCERGVFPDPSKRHPDCNMKLTPSNDPASPGGPPTRIDLLEGTSLQLSATDSRLFGSAVDWSVVGPGSVGLAGNVIANAGAAGGTLEVTATNHSDPADKATVIINIRGCPTPSDFTITCTGVVCCGTMCSGGHVATIAGSSTGQSTLSTELLTSTGSYCGTSTSGNGSYPNPTGPGGATASWTATTCELQTDHQSGRCTMTGTR